MLSGRSECSFKWCFLTERSAVVQGTAISNAAEAVSHGFSVSPVQPTSF